MTEKFHEPTTFKEASTSPKRDQWMEAMEKEMASLEANDVYDLVDLPKHRKAVGSKWVYKRKLKAVGSLQYLSTMTRPDITFAVANVAKYCSEPMKEHWTAVKMIMRYLKGTHNFSLLYKKSNSNSFIGFSDSDWAGNLDDRRSTSGYIFQVASTAVSWKSRKQSCVALSTAEAEYIALSQAAKEAIWLRQLNTDLQGESSEPTVLYEDNQAAICLSKNPQCHGRSKHIDIRYHFIREQVTNWTIELKYCETGNMVADMLTKGLGKERFKKL